MTAWKATAIPSQPVQSCGLALARFSGSTVWPPVRTTCTSARWKACPSTVGDASTRWLGPPAAAGAARQSSTTRAERVARRIAGAITSRPDRQTTPSASVEGRLEQDLAQAALEVFGRHAAALEHADRAA